jgi:predicted nucleic acid-binding protein
VIQGMIVVADTTPLNYLVLIGQIELLSALYRTVLIPNYANFISDEFGRASIVFSLNLRPSKP